MGGGVVGIGFCGIDRWSLVRRDGVVGELRAHLRADGIDDDD